MWYVAYAAIFRIFIIFFLLGRYVYDHVLNRKPPIYLSTLDQVDRNKLNTLRFAPHAHGEKIALKIHGNGSHEKIRVRRRTTKLIRGVYFMALNADLIHKIARNK